LLFLQVTTPLNIIVRWWLWTGDTHTHSQYVKHSA